MGNPNEKHRIALFTASLRVGGVERLVVNMSTEFARRGCAVDVVLASAEGPLLKQVHPDVRVINLKSRRVFASLPGLVKYLRSENPSALLTLQTHCNIVGILARKMVAQGPRLVLSEHNALATRMNGLTKELLLYLARYLYPQAQKIVAVSSGLADELMAWTGLASEKVITIHNPIVSEELMAMSEAALDHPWFAEGEPPVVLGVGRLVLQKDHSTLIRAFARLRQRRAVRLVILGEGEQWGQLQNLAEKLGIAPDVDMPGFDLNPYRYMRCCRVFVLSSAWEGLGNVLVEAMACGAPVVSTDCLSGPAEILEHGKYGSLVPVGDDAALAAAIEEALARPLPPETLRRRAADFSVAKSADAYLRVLAPEAE